MNRSSYIAKRYRLSKDCNVAEPDKTSHGWEQDGQIHWVNRAFPEEVVLLVFDDKEEKEQDYEEESNESDESEGKESLLCQSLDYYDVLFFNFDWIDILFLLI